MGYVVQDGGLYPHLTAFDNVALPAQVSGWPTARTRARAAELGEMVDLDKDTLRRYPRELSGGQRQRVGLMRALMLDPPILLLDEPLGALDPIVRAELQAQLKSLFQTLGKTVVLVTHDIREAALLGSVITLMTAGASCSEGASPTCSSGPPRLRDAIPHRADPGHGAVAVPSLLGACLVLLLLHGTSASAAAADGVIRVGSKSFTESYILAEIAAQVIDRVGEARAERQLGLGGTGLAYRALASGAIDLYPEYTGTLSYIILKDPALRTTEAIRARLVASGLTMSESLGFNNTYALAVRVDTADRLGLRRISDLQRQSQLTAAFSSGFLEREDGWPGLARQYGLSLAAVRVMSTPSPIRALASGEVDMMDVFSTDGQLERLRLRVLDDDRGFFPDYSAVLLARKTWPSDIRAPGRASARRSRESSTRSACPGSTPWPISTARAWPRSRRRSSARSPRAARERRVSWPSSPRSPSITSSSSSSRWPPPSSSASPWASRPRASGRRARSSWAPWACCRRFPPSPCSCS
jgi:glycine betaine/choline ABC-type transport system substrate-binding protein